MRHKTERHQAAAERTVKNIRRKTRKHYSSEEKIRIVLAGLRDEDSIAERGLDISYETIRRWFLKFGSVIAANLRHTRPRPSNHWHLNEIVIVIQRRRYWLWRAVDNEGVVLDFLVQSKRNAKAGKRLM
jgi:transposase-like protein